MMRGKGTRAAGPTGGLSLACVLVSVVAVIDAGVVAGPPRDGRGSARQSAAATVPTTLEDFFLPGTQRPGDNPVTIEPFAGAIDGNCVNCHSTFDAAYTAAEPFRHWVGGMMAHAMRDPLFIATMTIANQDAAFSGDLCLRCHTPSGWMGGRSVPTDGSALTEPADFEGVTCHFCHRMVDPMYESGVSPASDAGILDVLDGAGLLPLGFGSGRYVVDPDTKVRRGPRSGVNHPQGATAIYSPFHRESNLCGTCHDVSNPVYLRQGDGTYALTALDEAHPTGVEHEMFPIERTFSEWTMSEFAAAGVDLGGRFGGNHATGIMESCQDCHMPDQNGPGCRNSGTVRPDAPQHAFNGGNTWVLAAVRNMTPDTETGLTDAFVQDGMLRVHQMLQAASDTLLEQQGNRLRVRIVNYSGHKLPTGYPEGRRMWINVAFVDAQDEVIREFGAYDAALAELDEASTKVYEAKLGVDATIAAATGVPEGESFHFALNNVWLKDNRIPPMGFGNAAFESVRAAPVNYAYADGQYWDDTEFLIPPGAVQAQVTVYYQSTSRAYAEFLRDENATDDTGQVLHDQWVLTGQSAPAVMDEIELALTPITPGDVDGDGFVDVADLLDLLAAWGPCPSPPDSPECPADTNLDGVVDVTDLLTLLANWG